MNAAFSPELLYWRGLVALRFSKFCSRLITVVRLQNIRVPYPVYDVRKLVVPGWQFHLNTFWIWDVMISHIAIHASASPIMIKFLNPIWHIILLWLADPTHDGPPLNHEYSSFSRAWSARNCKVRSLSMTGCCDIVTIFVIVSSAAKSEWADVT